MTGGNISNIFGTIQTTGFGNANLFLMNPAGFLFGPNATVNVGGMVSLTSADYLKLADNARFNAIPNAAADALLTALPVASFGFLGSNPGAITVQGSQFTVTEGTGISLVGGNINIEAGTLDGGIVQPAELAAQGGQINLASVTSSGEVLATNFLPEPGMTRGTINVSQGSTLDVSSDGAGMVRIRGGQLVIHNATISSDTGAAHGAPIAIDINITDAVSLSHADLPVLAARTSGTGNAGDILVTSGSLDATFSSSTGSESLIDSHTMGSGHAGNVTITTGPLTMKGDPFAPGYFIDSGTGGEGNGGNVNITAGDAHFTSGGINTGDNTFFGAGSGGNLTIRAESLLLEDISVATDSFNARAGALTFEISGLMHVTRGFVSNISLLGENPTTIKADHLVLAGGTSTIISGTVISGTALGNAGDFTVTARVVEFLNGGTISTQTFGDGRAGNIQITASERVSLLNSPNDFRPSGLFSQSLGLPEIDNPFGTHGDAGNITLNTPQLELTNGARINSTTLTSGRGGDVTITTSGTVSITGERSIDVTEGIFALGGTRASGIYTKTLGSDICSGTCGNAGDINIITGSLTLQNGGLIDSGTTNNGQGGNTTILATDQVLLSGTMTDGTPSGIFSRTTGTDPDASNGGSILLKVNSVMIENGAQLSASSLGTGAAGSVTVKGTSSPAESVVIDGPGSGVFTNTEGTGAGGNIFVNGNTITIENGGMLSAKTSGPADTSAGGTIAVTATDTMAMTSGASITASSSGLGAAGSIEITATNGLTMQNSAITTEAGQGASGGDINVTTAPSATVLLENSRISASVADGPGGGGNISIDPQYVILQNSQILAQAAQGQGGAITITTNLFLPDATSIVNADSGSGLHGTVTIQSPNAPASGKIQPLGKTPLLPTSLLNQHCAALAGGEFSSFTVAGRDSLPTEPGSWLASPLYAAGVGEGRVGKAEGVKAEGGRSVVGGETPLLSLRQIAPAGFLTQAFAVDWSAGCQS